MEKNKSRIKFHPGEGSFTTDELEDILKAFRDSTQHRTIQKLEPRIRRFIELRKDARYLQELSEEVHNVKEGYEPARGFVEKSIELQKFASALNEKLRSIRATKDLLNPSQAVLDKFMEACKVAGKTKALAKSLEQFQQPSFSKTLRKLLDQSEKAASSTGAMVQALQKFEDRNRRLRNLATHSSATSSIEKAVHEWIERKNIHELVAKSQKAVGATGVVAEVLRQFEAHNKMLKDLATDSQKAASTAGAVTEALQEIQESNKRLRDVFARSPRSSTSLVRAWEELTKRNKQLQELVAQSQKAAFTSGAVAGALQQFEDRSQTFHELLTESQRAASTTETGLKALLKEKTAES